MIRRSTDLRLPHLPHKTFRTERQIPTGPDGIDKRHLYSAVRTAVLPPIYLLPSVLDMEEDGLLGSWHSIELWEGRSWAGYVD